MRPGGETETAVNMALQQPDSFKSGPNPITVQGTNDDKSIYGEIG